MQIPRLMIAAPQGRSGKTTVSIGLCAALNKRGLKVKPFKKGPDYIDPSWLSAAAGSSCTNLDTFLFPGDMLLPGFQMSCSGADLAVIEASMGLYDSSFENGKGSSAWMARNLQTPVILVVNCTRMTRSAAAMVSGYMNFERGTHIAGVILNNISGKRHAATITKALEHHCGIPVLGVLPRDADLHIPERHLGIVPAREHTEADSIINSIADFFETNADVDRIMQLALRTPELPELRVRQSKPASGSVKIGVLSDKVFTFYYPENLQALRKSGAELVYIDSLSDEHLPEIDALYIGGGFPELYVEQLEANASLRVEIAAMVEDGLPVYAECAGLMYLCRSICLGHQTYRMCGIIGADVTMGKKPQGHGYIIAEVAGENPFFTKGTLINGHEFHHSRIKFDEDPEFAYRMRRGFGVNGLADGVIYKNMFAAYAHIHAWGVPEWAPNFVRAARLRQVRINKVKV
jgi:cobyrinic acid a,c-diamide synthase